MQIRAALKRFASKYCHQLDSLTLSKKQTKNWYFNNRGNITPKSAIVFAILICAKFVSPEFGKKRQLPFLLKVILKNRPKICEIFPAVLCARLLQKKSMTMNVMIRDPFLSKLQFTGNLEMTASKASVQIAAAMWSLRPQVILCLKIKMLWERKMTNLISQSIIRMYGMRTIYVH